MTSEEPEKHPARINSNEIFQRNTSQTVDFEIVFAGLLAASLVSVSDISPTLDFVSVVGAISLLLFTMIRRMAVDNPFALEKELMDKSLTIILATTFFGILYIVALPAKIMHFRLGVNYYPSFGMLLLFLIFATVLLYEFKFRDLFYGQEYYCTIGTSNITKHRWEISFLIFQNSA